MKSLLSLPYLFMFFWLDPKEPKSQERKLAYRQAGIYNTFLSLALI